MKNLTATPQTDKLIAITKRVCAAERGRKAALARACGVLPSQVSEWFGGRVGPSAEAALLMLDWLAATDPDAWRVYGAKAMAA